ncbi:MAG TPA: topoisomerase DNA-binding C4 zinc finger domain-containing protein, partial [Acidobacteriaceae bacterium]|nr:topoisomerase DNA-binding C4 zinc finger domain-containing protein [Acidobacteriaceae bacterium]
GEGDIAERKTRFGTTFYGCTRYPKCDFTANGKPVPKKCPECGSSYLIEKTLKSGVYLTCPNNKKPAASDEKESKRKKKVVEEETTVTCHYSKRLRDAPAAEPPAVAASKRAKEETAQPVA